MSTTKVPVHAVLSAAPLPRPENNVYFPALDGFRAVALLLIFLDHYGSINAAGLGVNSFFVLSGFLITGILLDTSTRPQRVRIFYTRRVLRIFPLYYGVFLALLLATPLLHIRWSSAWLLWPIHLGNLLPFLPPWLPPALWLPAAWGQLPCGPGRTLLLGHFWSLCVEEQFYLLWPLIVFHSSRRSLLRLCTAVVLALPFVRLAALSLLPVPLVHNNILMRILPFQVDALLLGGFFALLWRGAHRALLLRWCTRLSPGVVLFAVWALFVHYRTALPLFPQPFATTLPLLSWQLSIVNLASAILLIAALQPASRLARLFSLSPLRSLGRISYGAYVFHDIPHQLYHHLGSRLPHPILATNLLAFAGTLALATLSYRFLEQPFLRLKARWG